VCVTSELTSAGENRLTTFKKYNRTDISSLLSLLLLLLLLLLSSAAAAARTTTTIGGQLRSAQPSIPQG